MVEAADFPYSGMFWDAATTEEQKAYYDALASILGTDDDDEVRRFHNLVSTALHVAGVQLVDRRYVQGLEAKVRLLQAERDRLREVRNDLRAQLSGATRPKDVACIASGGGSDT